MKPTDPDIVERISDLVQTVEGDPDSFKGRLIAELVQTCLKLVHDGHDTGQLKLMNSALKEMRYAYSVFNKYASRPKVSIFGSARTPEHHPDYIAAKEFSAAMARHGWMCITGAGDGIMKAGHEGPQRESSFGLSIRLPFETSANEVIEGDPKLINFRYFFTRKLMFMSHAEAIAVFPGGFGTQDELFESLVLVQTGKSNIVPIVLVEGDNGVYWSHWLTYVRKNLLENGWISPEDGDLFHIATSADDAVEHIRQFYRLYHSSRYVREMLVLRLRNPINDEIIEQLNDEFGGLVAKGQIEMSGPLSGETDHLELPRVVFHHTKYQFALIRRMIDRINELGSSNDAGLNAAVGSNE